MGRLIVPSAAICATVPGPTSPGPISSAPAPRAWARLARRSHVRGVDAAEPGLAVRPRHRISTARDALAERRERLVGQAVVVFDDVDGAERQAIREVRQRGGALAYRLEGGAEQWPLRDAEQRPQPMVAEAWPGEGVEERVRPV